MNAPASNRNDRTMRLLSRANHIVNSETIDGVVTRIGKWPRAKRREFARIEAKIARTSVHP